MTKGYSVALPAGAEPPLRVFVNGVPQSEGGDYRVERGRLIFSRPLAKEGRLGFWRWLSMFLAIAGTYRQNDSVDVQYTVGGATRLATGLDIEPPGGVGDPRQAS
ncbi:MAG: hypothetical protein NVSMB25_14490 [Thermoleophilaceae bacterium]